MTCPFSLFRIATCSRFRISRCSRLQRDRTRLSLQLQWGLSTGIAAVSHDSPADHPANAVGRLHALAHQHQRVAFDPDGEAHDVQDDGAS